MEKKAQVGFFVWAIIIIIVLLLGYFIIPLFFNSGTSTDYPYTVEHTNVGWYKLWLKDDHTTVYCFDNENFWSIINKAKSEGKKVEVTYQDYWIRGLLCRSGSDKIGTTVITNIKILE